MSLVCPVDINIVRYLENCSDMEKKIAHLFLKHRNSSQEISLHNKDIARAIGCTVRTVTRATTKFHNDGFIIKYPDTGPTHQLPNKYIFSNKVDFKKL